ncbi:unnamed protein product [Brachionus calyciflorus]|uniref:PDZ domain-containing protein n=1 Tax=Brachionus calyciflorus TaxID=104777 RepID=A0A813R664_9BILA|nr:unnamed protein product [Brachionus calyciflorus]
MKVTICFDDIKIIVPCGIQPNDDENKAKNLNNLKVSDIIDNAIVRYKKATSKPNNCIIRVLNLQTIRDGGILDPDDYIQDVVEDKEVLLAIYEEYQNEILISTNKSALSQLTINTPAFVMDTNYNKLNSLNNSSMSNGSSTSTLGSNHGQYLTNNKVPSPLDNYYYIQRNQVFVTQKDLQNNLGNLRVKSGSESCIYNTNKLNPPNLSLITVNTSCLNTQKKLENLENKIAMPENHNTNTDINYFSRISSNRQSIVKNENNLWAKCGHSNDYSEILSINLINDSNRNLSPGPLGIHVIPSYESNSSEKESGLIIQRIEPNGRVFKDGRLRIGDRIIEINNQNILGVDFVKCQDLLREAIMSSNLENGYLDLKIARSKHHDQSGDEDDEKIENKENSVDNLPQTYNSTSTNLSALNTKKLGKKITVQLIKGPQGLGFKLAARDNCTPGEYSPIYIKNILPKGAAITDGRLQRGDRLLEVNKIDMTQKTLHEAVNILRNTKLGDCVEIVVSRQVLPGSSSTLPRELNEPNIEETDLKNEDKNGPKRELLTFEIALNDTGSAGLGVSVKGKTKRLEESENSVDLGIFVKTVINGGAASKDGRLRANDQLININGFSLLGKSNEEAMLILREAMQVESRPGYIELTVSRKIKNEIKKENSEESQSRQFVKIISHNNRKIDEVEDERTSRFNRDAPNRRSMSEKRVKLGNVPANFQINKQRNQSSDPKRSQTVQVISGSASNYTTQTLGRTVKQPTQISNSISQKISQIYSDVRKDSSDRQDSFESDESKIPKSSTCSASISSLSNYTFASVNELDNREQNPKIVKRNFCLPINCKSSKLKINSKNVDKPLPKSAKKLLSKSSSTSFSITDSDSTSSLSPKNRNQFFIQSLTYSKLKPIELIAEDFSDFSKHFTDYDGEEINSSTSNSNSSHKSVNKLKPKVKSCFNIKLLKQSNEQNLVVQDQSNDSVPYYTEVKPIARKSTSMESIPQNIPSSSSSSDPKPKTTRPVVNVYNKFGTVSGASIQSNRPSLLINVSNQQEQQNNPMESNSNSRFRAVNRSFRTAVDKSLDIPPPQNDNQVTVEEQKKNELNKKQHDTKTKETKGLIGKFQNLFKSHHSSKKNSTEDINHTQNSKHPVELVNFHKIESNPKLSQQTSKPPIIPNPKTTSNNADVLIENDTMYTQYRPSSCQPPMPIQNPPVQKPYFANRESLFYHSTDNHRLTYSQRQQNFILEQQRILRQQQKKFLEQQEKLKEIEEQNHIVYQQREIKNYEDLKSRKNNYIQHSVPFNGSNQIHPVGELFSEVVHQFDRMNINQMSTKSQPAPMSDNYQKEFLTKTGYVNNEIPQLSGSSMSSSSASSSSSTSVSDRHHQFFPNQHQMLIQSHPAQV